MSARDGIKVMRVVEGEEDGEDGEATSAEVVGEVEDSEVKGGEVIIEFDSCGAVARETKQP